jgi:hypothetical protein
LNMPPLFGILLQLLMPTNWNASSRSSQLFVTAMFITVMQTAE